MASNITGPPQIDPGLISGLADPWISRQKELRAAGALSAGMDALAKGDYGTMAKTMQFLASDSPALATHLMTAFQADQSRRRQEAQFQQTFQQTGQHQQTMEWIAANTPHPTGEEDQQYGGGKAYAPIGLPPTHPLYRPPAVTAPAPVPTPPAPTPAPPSPPPPSTSGVPTPAVVAPSPAPTPPPAPAPATPPPEPPATPPPTRPPLPPQLEGKDRATAIYYLTRAGLQGEELMAALPVSFQRAVKQVANYERSPADFASRGSNLDKKLYEDLASAYDKTYVPGNYALVQKHLSGYTTLTGASAGARINNLNTASGHVHQMELLNEELSKGKFDIPAINSILQKLNVTLGGGIDVTSWNTLRRMIAPELAKVIGGASGLGVEERQGLANDIAATASPGQALARINVLKGAMAERYAVGHQQFNTETYGKRPFGYSEKLSGNSMKMMLEKEGVNVADVSAKNLEMLLKARDDKEKLAKFDMLFQQPGRAQEILDGLR